MRPFDYRRIDDGALAVQAMAGEAGSFLAGGTTLLDLMKLDVMRPDAVIDINGLDKRHGEIRIDDSGLHLGALVRMGDAAAHAGIRKSFPVIAQSLDLAASPQIRNMASLGGNVLQRTRCTYFRDTRWSACNKRNPGSGCAALDGVTRKHAVLGGSPDCIAAYPGDFAQALVALDADVELLGANGPRVMRFEDLHRLPGNTPHVETDLKPGELITGFRVPAAAWARRSLYLKLRDRESYEFALASAAVALDLDGETVREARIGLGGVATKPWRARDAEAALKGRTLDEGMAQHAATLAFAGAKATPWNGYKIELGQRTLVRALLEAAKMEV
ncbi:MAG TPA: xanthine dehydrogenase family protein subunit M [Dongiaceae bacterium]|jgi:xanthine dehydrogenase YagS FAD-binding subunit|nr:xanthine dehydrogenase family protein subunit M [Dongiaceae bacterium]